ncbi:DUF4252 domain-containing protein [Polaribacter gochangensis]|uniref:DUF4252 domain-containing protein n=1 Tax=Polaribacter gochangensis TaxID=3252903 RepID=UPI003904D530
MKKITTLIVAFILVFSFTSCKEESLQSYLVKSQEKSGFITFDVPASILQIKSDNVSEATKTTLKSIKKINVVAIPFKENATEVEAEKAQLDKILKGKEYKSLMRFTEKNMKISLYYTGESDAIDELIAFGYGAKQGVGVARILGDNMNPSNIMKMINEVKFDADGINLDQFKVLFK